MALKFDSKVLHAGIEPDPLTGAVMTPIYQTSTYAQASPGVHKGYEYSRTDNPTRTPLQTQLAALEGADAAFVFSSGLASTDAVLNLLQSGDHIVAGDDLYGGTFRLFTQVAQRRGLTFTFVDMANAEQREAAFTPATKLVWMETPTNPLLKVVSIAKVAASAKAHNCLLAVDNTFLSPYNQRPLEHGADIVMHSMTKFINGHSDVVMGCLAVRDRELPFDASTRLAARLKYLQNAIGAVPGPQDCFLVLRGIKTLSVRMERHNANAMKVAEYLSKHPKVDRVVYPGLPSHPQHELAKAQTHGFGGMVTFFTKGGLDEARIFLENVQMFALAESLGGVESLVDHPAIMTHASIPLAQRLELGITDSLIRLSVGIEDSDDIIADLDQALAKI